MTVATLRPLDRYLHYQQADLCFHIRYFNLNYNIAFLFLVTCRGFMEYQEREYLKYRVGEDAPNVLVDAVHAKSPRADLHTGEIADRVAEESGCHCIIATVSRTQADLNRPPKRSDGPQAIHEYRRTIAQILSEAERLGDDGRLHRPFLHLAVHGWKDNYPSDVEVGTRWGNSCSPEIQEWIVQSLQRWTDTFEGERPIITVNQYKWGDESKVYHRKGDDENYLGYGEGFNTVQLEFAYWLRSGHRVKVIRVLSEMARKFETSGPGRWGTT